LEMIYESKILILFRKNLFYKQHLLMHVADMVNRCEQ
jgi:hypothetical protein